ncbi:MAG: hypothetical protein Q8S02_13495 [Hydrogenophaga sp.]|nr:hypothetical protein [Hydrogenophaga sp.]
MFTASAGGHDLVGYRLCGFALECVDHVGTFLMLVAGTPRQRSVPECVGIAT